MDLVDYIDSGLDLAKAVNLYKFQTLWAQLEQLVSSWASDRKVAMLEPSDHILSPITIN
jgi:hypothetical protein